MVILTVVVGVVLHQLESNPKSTLDPSGLAHNWKLPKYRRAFLDGLIKGSNIDSLYSASYRFFYAHKGAVLGCPVEALPNGLLCRTAHGLLAQSNNAVVTAILVEFPEYCFKRWH